MAKKPKTNGLKKPIVIYVMFCILTLILGLIWYATSGGKSDKISHPNSTIPHVDGQSAVDQVDNFYRQYVGATAKPETQKLLVNSYGSQNLVFYKEYYLHGFDPITCYNQTPSKIVTKLISEGPTAKVGATLTYPDGTSALIKVNVVLNDGLQIDSLTCPAPNGDLAPIVTS